MQTEGYFGWLKAANQSNKALLLDVASKKEPQFSPLYDSGSYIATGITNPFDAFNSQGISLCFKTLVQGHGIGILLRPELPCKASFRLQEMSVELDNPKNGGVSGIPCFSFSRSMSNRKHPVTNSDYPNAATQLDVALSETLLLSGAFFVLKKSSGSMWLWDTQELDQ